MEKTLAIILITPLIITCLRVSSKNCQNKEDRTVCHNLKLKENDPLEIEDCMKTLKVEPPLKEIPRRLFVKLPHLEVLILNFTLMKKIYSHSFDGLANLNKLDLYLNQLSHIPVDAFHGSRKLTYLNLGGNDLENINGGVFAHLNDLKELIISSNLLSSVPKLGNLPNLTLLDLSRNKIKELNKDCFNGLARLINLNLKGNQMSYIEENAFQGLAKLEYLNLEKNALTSISVTNIKSNLPSLKEIRLNINHFSCATLVTLVQDFRKNRIFLPEGLAEPGPISHHGIFCIPLENSV